jgi:putative peptidoglycan lipid II flippase
LASRATGLVRTLLILFLLAEGLNDAYLNANNTPNMIYELILGGILTASLVPLFTEDLERGDGRTGTSALISFALVALLVVTAIGFLAGPALVLLFSTGALEARRDDYLAAAVPLSLLFAPQIFFYGLMAVWSAALNARNRFMAPAWSPVLNNLIAIATLATAASLADDSPTLAEAITDPAVIWVLGLGTTLGIAVMALALYPSLRRAQVRLNFSFQPRHPLVRQAVRLSAWTFGYVVANQIAVVVIQILAKPSSGDPTRYQTAFQWFQLPHALLAVSIMVTFQPLLGRADARQDRVEFNRHLLLGFRLIALLVIPAAVGYVALPKGLDARTFVATGNLDEALGLTGIIAAFAVGLPGFSLYLYAFRGFYAMKDTKTPFVINCMENAINVALAVVFVRWWGVVGLASAFALAYNVAAVVAVGVLARRSPGFDVRALVGTLAKLTVAAAVMGGFVYGVVVLLAPGSPGALVPAVAVGIVVGVITYLAAVYALAVPGVDELLARVRRRGRRRGATA